MSTTHPETEDLNAGSTPSSPLSDMRRVSERYGGCTYIRGFPAFAHALQSRFGAWQQDKQCSSHVKQPSQEGEVCSDCSKLKLAHQLAKVAHGTADATDGRLLSFMLASFGPSTTAVALSCHPTSGSVLLNTCFNDGRSPITAQIEPGLEALTASQIQQGLASTLRHSPELPDLHPILQMVSFADPGAASIPVSEGLIERRDGCSSYTQYGTRVFTIMIQRLMDVHRLEDVTLEASKTGHEESV